ncbi:unnamed protein product [Onchocerca flexuosa]|uniref:Trimeric intracellular cation channel type B n=1 Tax=Onchocerca flexuosa TaxID=387005 RepID=A0A183H1M1_9BILA|nr:unnamed protein product [Onchocerca flexuosa]
MCRPLDPIVAVAFEASRNNNGMSSSFDLFFSFHFGLVRATRKGRTRGSAIVLIRTLEVESGIEQILSAMAFMDYMKLDQEVLAGAAGRVQRLKMYPYFDLAHYILMTISVRDDLATGASLFSRKHPLSCWLSSMLMCFAGIISANFLLGEPVIAPFKRHDDILLVICFIVIFNRNRYCKVMLTLEVLRNLSQDYVENATVVWYFVFYSPFDIVYKVSKLLPVRIILCILKEVRRTYKVAHGVSYASKLYPSSYLVHILVGTARGAGSGILRTVEQLVRGVWIPAHNEVLRPSFSTKACCVASVILVVERHSRYITAPHDIIYLGIVGFFVYFKLSAILLNVQDPFAPFENLFCAVFMGGIWDAMSRAVMASRERRAVGQKAENGALPAEPKKEQ